jgi:hypothetical protein
MGASASIVEATLKSPVDGSDLSERAISIAEVKKIREMVAAWHIEEQQRIDYALEIGRRRSRGMVRIVYEQYTDCFAMTDGVISIAAIDEEYCLSDVMPGCTLELLEITPQSRIENQISGIPSPFISKTVDNLSWDMLYTYDEGDGEPKSYWVVAFQDPVLLAADLEATKKRMGDMDDGGDAGVCTCTNGKPCSKQNKKNCKDFNNRFVVAKKYKAWLSSSIAPSANHNRYGGVVAE